MSKIAMISTTLGPQTIALSKALQVHRHEVMHITSKNQIPPFESSLPTLTFFEKWSAWEAIKFFPHLTTCGADIFHFVSEDSDPHSVRLGHVLMAQFLRALPQKIIVASFFQSHAHKRSRWPLNGPLNLMEPFLNAMDVVTFPTQERLLWNRRNYRLKKLLLSDILPPLPQMNITSPAELTDKKNFDDELVSLVDKLTPYLLIPASQEIPEIKKLHEHGSDNILNQYKYAYWGERTQRAALNPFYFGPLNEEEKIYTVANAKALLLAFSEFSSIELQKFLEISILTGTPLIVRPRQIDLVPGLVRAQKTGFVLDKGISSLQNLLESNPHLKVSEKNSPEQMQSLTDSCLNELNRLYNKAFSIRWS